MKITCVKENLRKSLNLATKIISTATTLPILNNLFLKTEKGRLKISSTNLEIALKSWVGAKIDETGETTVPAKTFTDFINNIKDEKITLETKGHDLIVKTNKTNSLIKGLPADEFPLIPEVKSELTVNLDSKVLADGLNQVSFAAAVSETQPELSGVLFNFHEDQLRLAATDRYRLAEKTITLNTPVPPKKIIVPIRAVAELSRLLSESGENIEVVTSENQILFRGPNHELISRLVEGEYPDYQQIVPKDFSTQAVVGVDEFVNALKLTGLFVQDTNNVELEIITQEKKVVLKSTSQKFGSNTSWVEAEIEGADNQIIFNYRYILDSLTSLNSQEAVLKIINSGSPAMVVPKGSVDYYYLVMPIKV